MKSFKEIYETACLHKGGKKALEDVLPRALTKRQLVATKDDRFLSNMSRRIFQAGLKHEMVNGKWPTFEKVFKRFDPFYCAMLSEDDIDTLMQDTRVIRHLGKLRAIRENAQYIRTRSEEHNGFGRFLASWPEENIVDLWLELKKQGKQLGGFSGPAFLRMVGKDTFLLTKDVVAVLMAEKIIDKTPTAKRDMVAAQEAFLIWREESGRSFCEISRVVSCAAC